MSNSPNNIKIRPAIKEDMAQVFQLIKDLAEFEKMPDQVKINAKTLEEDAFGSASPAFKCFVATENTNVVGYALYYICYSTWLGKSIFLEDLYVKDELRHKGVGKKLFLEVAKIANSTSTRLDLHVLRWNPACTFYKKLGARNLTDAEEWNLFRLDGNDLKKLCEDNS